MKIALLTDGISPYVLGGMQRHSFYLVKYLAQNKLKVDLFHFNQSSLDIDKLDAFSEEEKKYINSIVVPFPQTIRFPGHYIYRSYLHSKLIFQKIKPHLQEYDFIYVQGFTGWELINQKKRGEIKCASIGVNFHGFEMFQQAPDFKTKLQLLLLQKPVLNNMKNADYVFSFGAKIKELISAMVPDEKIIVMHNGIEKSWLNETQKSISEFTRFIFLGRAERRKGIEELNQALRNMKDKQNFHFTFVGPIPEHLKISSSKISYLGEIRDDKRLKEILFSQDVLVCPSHSEGMPNVILEAMANQLAVIATDVGAVSLLVNEKNGWLLPKADADVLEQALIEACTINKKELQFLQENSLHKVKENFLWEMIIKNLIQKS